MTRLTPHSTMQDLLDCVANDPALKDGRRRNIASSIRRFVALLNLDLTMPANFPVYRDRLAKFRGGDVSERNWQNIRSNVSFALKQYGAASRTSYGGPLQGAWKERQDSLKDPRLQRGLSRFLRWAAANGILPDGVDDAVMARFHVHLVNESFERKPQHIHRDTCTLWNRAVDTVTGWPQNKVTVPNYRKIVSLPLDAFPASFVSDLNHYASRLAGQDLTADGIVERPLRPATIQQHCSHVRRFASAMVREGRAIDEVTSISVLFDAPYFETAIQGEHDRLEGPRPSLQELTNTLAAIGRHYVGLSESRLDKLAMIKRRLRCRPRGFTERNLARIRPFRDPRKQQLFLSLGDALLKEAARQKSHERAALRIQTALIHEIMLVAPMRYGNLVSLNLHDHIAFARPGRKGAVTISFVDDEVKNDVPLEYVLPTPIANLLRHYLEEARPALLAGPDKGWLFPGAKPGEPKHQVSLSDQLTKAVTRLSGLVVNPHLYRHIAAFFYLQEHPTDLETVRRLLGHKSIETTSMFYADFERTLSIERYGRLILNRRNRLDDQYRGQL